MLQRQIMFKKLQEMQRRQQLQDLGGAKNQDYVDHQLSSLKQTSSLQFSPKLNEQPIQDPQMFSMQMAQHGGSTVFQGFPNGLVHPQSHNHDLGHMGISQPQFDMSLYGHHGLIRNSNQYSPSSFTSQQGSFGQVPDQSLNADWLGISHGETSKIGISHSSDSLDPLEQKILYNTEDNNNWEFSFGENNKMENTSYMGALPSNQKGSWSALMQSAVMEGSSSDTAIQEEWSALSFQNPELLTENQPSSFVNSEKPNNNWVDRNLQNVSSPSSEPSNVNYSSHGFKQSEYQYLKQRNEFQPNVLSCTNDKSPCIDFLGHESRDTLWHAGNAPNHVSGGIQRDGNPGMQLSSKVLSPNQLPLTETSVASFGFKMGPTDAGTTQPHAFFPSFSMGNSSATSVSNHYANDYIKNQLPAPSVQSHMTTNLSAYNAASSQINRQTKSTSFGGPQFSWSDINSQQDMSKPNKLLDSLFQSPDSPSSFPETSSGAPNEQPNQSRFKHDHNVQEFHIHSGKSGYGERRSEKEGSFNEGSTEMHNPTPVSRNIHTQETLRAFGHSLHQGHSPINAETEYGKKSPLKYDSINYQTVANARELLLSGQKSVVQDKEDNKGRNFAQEDKEDQSRKNDTQNHLILHGHNVQELHIHSGKSGYGERRLEKEGSFKEGSTEMHNPTSLSRNIHTQETLRAFGHSLHQVHSPINAESDYGKKLPLKYDSINYQTVANARELLLSGQKSVVQDKEDNKGWNFSQEDKEDQSRKNDTQNHLIGRNEVSNSAYQSQTTLHMSQTVANARELLLSGQKSVVQDKEDNKGLNFLQEDKEDQSGKNDTQNHLIRRNEVSNSGYQSQTTLHMSQTVANARELLLSAQKSIVQDKEDNKGWNFSQEDKEDQSGKNDTQNHLIGCNEVSNSAYQSQTTLHMSQTVANARELLSGQKSVVQDKEDNKGWNFSQEDKEDQPCKSDTQKLIGRNEVSNSAYQSQTTLHMSQPGLQHYGTLKNGLTIANLQENSSVMQIDSANASQGSGIWPSSAVALIANKNLSSPSMLPSNVTNYQNLSLSKPMKRKIVAFDMIPWHKEVNDEEPRLQNIRMAELEWAQATNSREEEAEVLDDVLPLVRAKRRLIFTTQLMQQVFRPVPAVILSADARSNFDDVAYSTARLALGDACNLTSNLPPDTTVISPDKLKTSKRPRACNFSKVVEGLISRVQKLEGDLSRLDQKISIVDIKVEIQELEKFSTINRFAIRAHSSTVDSTSSSVPLTVHKPNPQRYVRAVPLPKTLPEGIDCVSL